MILYILLAAIQVLLLFLVIDKLFKLQDLSAIQSELYASNRQLRETIEGQRTIINLILGLEVRVSEMKKIIETMESIAIRNQKDNNG